MLALKVPMEPDDEDQNAHSNESDANGFADVP